MGWKEVTVMSQRYEFVMLALQENTNFSELCYRFGISRKTGYKFLNRFKQQSIEGLYDRSKRPKHSPNKTVTETEELILNLRDKHPVWGARKLKQRLQNLGYSNLPATSTITAILKRNRRISPEESLKHKAWNRFEAERPNDLWQMDFKGYFAARDGRCHPLTVLDDHSRYALCIAACKNQRRETVTDRLKHVFRRYGLPYAMLMDNGSPWGWNAESSYTVLTVWLMRLGIKVIHSRPFHPQTLGKDERFHRTLKAEALTACIGKSFTQCQFCFDTWRTVYNNERPHEALNMQVPANCYHLSNRTFTETLPEIEYGPFDQVRKVQHGGMIHFKNREFKVSKAFKGQRIAIRSTNRDGQYDVFFCQQKIGQIS